MKNFLIKLTIILLFGALTAFLFNIKNSLGQEQLFGKLFVDFKEETAVYTESQSFGVQTTVTVPENKCNQCLRDNNPSACLVKCDQVMMVY